MLYTSISYLQTKPRVRSGLIGSAELQVKKTRKTKWHCNENVKTIYTGVYFDEIPFCQKDYHGNQIYLNASSRIRIVMRKKIYRHNYHYRNLSDPTSWIKLALWSLLESEHWVSIPFGSDSEVSLKKTGCGAAQLLEILNPGAGLKWLLRAADNA